MQFRFVYVASVVLAMILVTTAAPAQTSAPITEEKRLMPNESAAARRKALEKEQAERQQRLEASEKKDLEAVEARNRKLAACRKLANDQHLHWLKRRDFLKGCMAS